MRILLVHGMGDTSSVWDAVAAALRARGHEVATVDSPLATLAGDVANAERALDGLAAPVVLVGHSYGGAVITGAGNHPSVAGLVYVAAFAPDAGESVQRLVEDRPAAAASSYMRRNDENAWIPEFRDGFWDEVGWDVTAAQRELVERQTRWTADRVFAEATATPAWRRLPSWYVIAEDDRTLLTELQETMAERMGATVTRLPGSHFTQLVHADAVAEVVDRAAAAVAAVGEAAS